MGKNIKVSICTIALATSLAACTTDTQNLETTIVDSTDETTTNIIEQENSEEKNTEQFTDRDLDPSYDESEAININFNDDEIISTNDSLTIDSNTVTINEEGIYVFTGSLSNGQIIVDTDSESKVQIVLDNVEIINDVLAPIYVKQADKVFVTILDGTSSTLTTISDIEEEADTNIDGVIYSKDDLVINGDGILNISSSENGVVSKDDLKLCNVTLNISAENHGLEANDSIRVSGADLNIEAFEDGINVGSDDSGDIYIASGNIDIIAGDDGMHSTSTITIDGGNITIIESNEGIESALITINEGYIDITSSDDGFNATSDISDDICLEINGGEVHVDASGDGLDSNGDITINGGETYVVQHYDKNGPIDYNGVGSMNGGILIAVGSSDMLQTIESTTQGTIITTVTGDGDLTLTNSNGDVIAQLDTDSTYEGVYISASGINESEEYTLQTGSSTTTIEMTSLNYSSGVTSNMSGKKGK